MSAAEAFRIDLSGPPADSPRTPGEALRVFYRHGSPRILTAALVLALAARVAVSGWSLWDLLPVALLLVFWPIQEWLIHVFVLHWKPRQVLGRTLDFLVPREHRAHHRDPWNHEILFIPLPAFLYSLPLLVALWLAIMPTTALALTGIAGHLALALHYEWIHLLIHTRVQPRTAFYRRLWRNHRLHHFKNERYWFGVTRLEADRLLGTDPEPGAVPPSPTARTLGVTPPGLQELEKAPGA
jgi:hypothetical protein